MQICDNLVEAAEADVRDVNHNRSDRDIDVNAMLSISRTMAQKQLY